MPVSMILPRAGRFHARLPHPLRRFGADCPRPQPGIPESFRVMLKELQSLGLDVVVQDKDGNEIDMRQNFDDEETGFDMRDVAGTETVVQESELLNDYNIKDADAGFDDPSVLEDDNSGAEAPASSDEVDF